MGLDAQVVAIGTFSKSIVDSLEYPSEFYKETQEGVTVISNVFIAVTSSGSHLLAECFGVDAWDFNKHELDLKGVDTEKLLKSEFAEDVPRFLTLRDAGFKFYYLPNG